MYIQYKKLLLGEGGRGFGLVGVLFPSPSLRCSLIFIPPPTGYVSY